MRLKGLEKILTLFDLSNLLPLLSELYLGPSSSLPLQKFVKDKDGKWRLVNMVREEKKREIIIHTLKFWITLEEREN